MRVSKTDRQPGTNPPARLRNRGQQYYCEQNQKYSQMLVEMLRMNQPGSSAQVDYGGYVKLLGRFN